MILGSLMLLGSAFVCVSGFLLGPRLQEKSLLFFAAWAFVNDVLICDV